MWVRRGSSPEVEASLLLADMTTVDVLLQIGKEQLRRKEWLVF
jgi:hypothetical protein